MFYQHTNYGLTTRVQVAEGAMAVASTLTQQAEQVFRELARRWDMTPGAIAAIYLNRFLGTLDFDLDSIAESLADELQQPPSAN